MKREFDEFRVFVSKLCGCGNIRNSYKKILVEVKCVIGFGVIGFK